MSKNAKILVVSSSPEVLQAIGRVVKPLSHLLFQASTLRDIELRFRDLQPDLLVLDGDFEPVRDSDALQELIATAGSRAVLPQVMLLTRHDDALRKQLVAACAPNCIVDKPLDDLELSVEVRTLVRVRQITAAAVRDRDVLNHLFELSAFSQRFASAEELLTALAQRVGKWIAAPHVVITLGGETHAQVAAQHHDDHLGHGRTMVDRRHGEVHRSGQLLLIEIGEGVMAGDDPTTLPYIGVPLRTTAGESLGALHAWGGEQLPSGADLRVLRVAAERISTEIQLRDSHRRLEEMVEDRTADLTAALSRLRAVNDQLLEASRDTVNRLARAAEYRDGDTGEHVERMSSYAACVARQLGMSAEDQALIKLVAPMHDVGKIGIPDSILLKAGKLTTAEYDVMKQHPLIGETILTGSRSKLLQMAERIAAQHHEKWDGTGYPRGVQGQNITLEARVVALADVFDALTSPRVYKDAWSVDEAVSYILSLSGTHFDPRVVEAFEGCIDRLIDIRTRLTAESNGDGTGDRPVEGPSIHHAEGVPA